MTKEQRFKIEELNIRTTEIINKLINSSRQILLSDVILKTLNEIKHSILILLNNGCNMTKEDVQKQIDEISFSLEKIIL